MQITKKVDFCAAHSIRGAGKCENKHGHNWEATITVSCQTLDHRGFIADVAAIKQAAFRYDHDDLDKYFERPTTENVAQRIGDDALKVVLEAQPEAKATVTVHLVETKNNSADAVASNEIGKLQEYLDENNIQNFREVGLAGSRQNETG